MSDLFFAFCFTIELTTSFKVFQLLNLMFSHSIRRTAQGVSFNDDFLDHLLKQIPHFVIVLVEKHSGSSRVNREQELNAIISVSYNEREYIATKWNNFSKSNPLLSAMFHLAAN